MGKEKLMNRKCRFCPEIIAAPSKLFGSAQNKHGGTCCLRRSHKHREPVKQPTGRLKRSREKQRETEQRQRGTEKVEGIEGGGVNGHRIASTAEGANVFLTKGSAV